MKKILFGTFALVILANCEKKNNHDAALKPDFDSTAVISESQNLNEPILTHCFESVTDKDTIALSYEDNLGTITGKMSYKNAQKDSSKGDISGLISGDTLKLTYTFDSEGTTSNREIWFLKKGENLLESAGKYDESGEYYANPKSVKFEEAHTLSPVDCKNIKALIN